MAGASSNTSFASRKLSSAAGAPQYTLRIKDWKTDAITGAEAFAFKPPEGATKASLEDKVMLEFDEVPPGTTTGASR